MKTACTVLALAVALLIANPLFAAKKKDGGIPYFKQIDKYLKPVTLTDDQKSKLEDLKKEYEPKFKEAYAKEDVLTPEQKKAGDEAKKAAKAEGKKGQDLKDAVVAAQKETDDQKKQATDARAERTALEKELHKKIVALLTDEQKAQIKAAKGKKSDKPAKEAATSSCGEIGTWQYNAGRLRILADPC